MKRNDKTRRRARRIIRLATIGGLSRIRGGITASQLAGVICREGYTGLHYAAHFGTLTEIRGGVTAEKLASVRSHCDWILEYDAGTGKPSQICSGISALSVAATYGHLDQIKGIVTLENLAAATEGDGRSALTALKEMINEGEDATALGNNICACPEILGLLTVTNPMHVKAVRHAICRNRSLEAVLSPQMTAAVL